MDENELQELLKESRGKIPWHHRFLMQFWPKMWFKIASHNLGTDNKVLDKLHEAFGQVQRVDIVPLRAARGFMIILDGKMSFWFLQNGDSFKYDGFEMGEYDKGDVAIFDNLKK